MSHTLCLGLVGFTRAVEGVGFAFGRGAPLGYEAGSLGVSLHAVTRTLYVAHALPRACRLHARCRGGWLRFWSRCTARVRSRLFGGVAARSDAYTVCRTRFA